jgi:hypothetical protein
MQGARRSSSLLLNKSGMGYLELQSNPTYHYALSVLLIPRNQTDERAFEDVIGKSLGLPPRLPLKGVSASPR